MQTEPVIYTINAIEEKETTDIDQHKLVSYLSKHLRKEEDWTGCKIYRCTSGYSNAPYIIKCGSNKYVLRLRDDHKDWGEGAKLFKHNIRKQYKLISALYKHTEIPVPKMYLYCDDEGVIGKEFYIMQFKEGRVFTHIGPHLPTIPKNDRIKIYREMVRVLSLVHAVDIYKTGIFEMLKDQSPWNVDTVYNEWKSEMNDAINDPEMIRTAPYVIKFNEMIHNKIVEYEENNCDSDLAQLTTLNHGDYHWENLIWHPTEYKIIALVDWECCSLGNPLFELAYTCFIWHGFNNEAVNNLNPPFEYYPGFKYVDVKQLGIPTETQHIMNYMSEAKKVLSSSIMNRMVSWFKIKNNWTTTLATHGVRNIGGMYILFKNLDQDARLAAAFGGEREYILANCWAEHSVTMLQEQEQKQTPKFLFSKL